MPRFDAPFTSVRDQFGRWRQELIEAIADQLSVEDGDCEASAGFVREVLEIQDRLLEADEPADWSRVVAVTEAVAHHGARSREDLIGAVLSEDEKLGIEEHERETAEAPASDHLDLMNRGTARLATGLLEQARDDLDRAVRMEPLEPGGYERRAALRAAQGLLPEAIEDLRAAVALASLPEVIWIRPQLVDLLMRSDQASLAIHELERHLDEVEEVSRAPREPGGALGTLRVGDTSLSVDGIGELLLPQWIEAVRALRPLAPGLEDRVVRIRDLLQLWDREGEVAGEP